MFPGIPDNSVRNLAAPQTDLDNDFAKFQNDCPVAPEKQGVGRIGLPWTIVLPQIPGKEIGLNQHYSASLRTKGVIIAVRVWGFLYKVSSYRDSI